jgi:AraC-like DNA-binding protein
VELDRLAALSRRWRDLADLDGVGAPAFPDVLVLESSRPTPLTAELYEPIVCLILQGAKTVLLGQQVHHLGRGNALVVSHHVPVVSRITSARVGQPYLAVILWLDVGMLRSLDEEAGHPDGHVRTPDTAHALTAMTAEPPLIDAIGRYLALAEDEVAARVLAPALRREIHFRLLTAPGGAMLRGLLRHNSHASLVGEAISRIRAGYRETISMAGLGREIGMSPSSLHRHFRAITATTPLQFQKDLRLLEARRLLIAGRHSVSEVAYEVGYESPNQFSREYSRKYGVPPSSERLRVDETRRSDTVTRNA